MCGIKMVVGEQLQQYYEKSQGFILFNEFITKVDDD